MSNDAVVAKCTLPDQDRPEGIELHKDGTWKSPAGGWMARQNGTWTQAATAGVLLSGAGIDKLALLQGMIFTLVNEGDTGVFRYDYGGNAGGWTCMATMP